MKSVFGCKKVWMKRRAARGANRRRTGCAMGIFLSAALVFEMLSAGGVTAHALESRGEVRSLSERDGGLECGGAQECGERMCRIAGLNIDIYRKLPFQTRYFEKGMRELTVRSQVRSGGESVRILSLEDRMVFRLASCSYQYVRDELLIRDMLDLFLYHKVWREKFDGNYVKKKLQEFRVDELADRLLRLAYMWFGEKEDKIYIQSIGQIEELSSFDILENRILNRGEFKKDHETDPQVLGLTRLLKKEEEKEMRKARRETRKRRWAERKRAWNRSLQWVFPDYKYMSTLYPTLEKIPFLLPLYWLFRGLRLLFGLLIKGGNQQS